MGPRRDVLVIDGMGPRTDDRGLTKSEEVLRREALCLK